MLRQEVNQTLEWLLSVQKTSTMLINLLLAYVSGEMHIRKPSKDITHNKQILEKAKLTKMTSIVEISLLLIQPVQLTSTINAFPQTPIVSSPAIKMVYITSIVLSMSTERSDLGYHWGWIGIQLTSEEGYICLSLRSCCSFLFCPLCQLWSRSVRLPVLLQWELTA